MRTEDRKPSKRVFPLLQNLDLDNVTFAQVQGTGNPITIEDMNEQEMVDLIIVNLARLSVAGEWDGLLDAGSGASTLAALTDVSMDITNFVDSLLIQTNSNGSAPSTGTLDSASNNLGIGKDVFAALTSGDTNIGLGVWALKTLEDGTNNVAVGAYAGRDVSSGLGNTMIGASSGYGISTGQYNVIMGYNAASAAMTGSHNIALGYTALNATTSGGKNIAIGHAAGTSITTGANNVVIGGMDVATADGDDQLVISAGDGGHFYVKGDSSGACFQGDNATAWSQTSDRVLKREITDATKGLDAINEIQVRNFRYRKDNEYGLDPETSRVGVIAQELEEVFPESVKENLQGHKTVSPDSINWALLKAVQELSAKVEALESAA